MLLNEGRREGSYRKSKVMIDCSLRYQALRQQGIKAEIRQAWQPPPFSLPPASPSAIALSSSFLSLFHFPYLPGPPSVSSTSPLCRCFPTHTHSLSISSPHPSLAQLTMSSQRYQRVSPPADLDESHNHDPNPSRFFFGCASLKPDTDRDRETGECPRRRRSACPPVESAPSKSHTFLSTPLVPLSLLLSFVKTASSRCFSQQE